MRGAVRVRGVADALHAAGGVAGGLGEGDVDGGGGAAELGVGEGDDAGAGGGAAQEVEV